MVIVDGTKNSVPVPVSVKSTGVPPAEVETLKVVSVFCTTKYELPEIKPTGATPVVS